MKILSDYVGNSGATDWAENANIPGYDFKWLLCDSELGWRIIMMCFSEWRTIPDKQRKI